MGESVPRRSNLPTNPTDSFGDRLASLRTAAGLSQRQLEKVSGVSHRMIAYYEKRPTLPPGHVLPALADALGCSVDELVGTKPPKAPPSSRRTSSRRLMRRLQQLEKLPLKDKKELLSIIDTYLEKNRLTQRAG
jgi:transcriptional regulator with XRE-family HTH domain